MKTFQTPACQLLATCMTGETGGVAVVFKGVYGGCTGLFLQAQRRVFEVMIAAHGVPTADSQAHIEAPDRPRISRQVAHRAVMLRRQTPKHSLVITKHQQMIIRAVAKVVVNTLFFTQPLDKVQVAFCVLHTERAWRIDHRAKFKSVGIGKDTVMCKYGSDDLRHAALLENPLVTPMG